MTSFIVSVALAFVIVLFRELRNPQSMLRGIQERNYGGMAFFFGASSITLGLFFWAVYLLLRHLF